MSRELCMKIQLIVEELFVNTVNHGHAGDSEAAVEVTIALDEEGAELIYVDSAPAFDPFADVSDPDGAAAVEGRPVGGLGLYLITRLADRYDYERAGDHNRITVHVRLPPATAAPGLHA